jgi:hypothetical protein
MESMQNGHGSRILVMGTLELTDTLCMLINVVSFQINLVIFILALRSALSSSKVNMTRTLEETKNDSTKTKATVDTALRKAKMALKGSAILFPLLGMTWIFGLLVFNRETIAFKYLFAICNSLQGMMIFVFHVLINKKVLYVLSQNDILGPLTSV